MIEGKSGLMSLGIMASFIAVFSICCCKPRAKTFDNEASPPANEETTTTTATKGEAVPLKETVVTAPPSPAAVVATIEPTIAPKKRYDPSKITNPNRHKIHLAAGCFWSVELILQRTVGVYSTKVGYTQGNTLNPTYETVKKGGTGHAESVEVVYDVTLISLEELLNVFWKKHDPTTKNKAGNDKGTQYRSGIYYFTTEQKDVILKSVEQEKSKLEKPWLKIHTEVLEASTFYPAEDYHQKYLSDNFEPGIGKSGKVQQSSEKMCSDPIRCYG
jgi:peptide-methionine (S)-S-oxide reductase